MGLHRLLGSIQHNMSLGGLVLGLGRSGALAGGAGVWCRLRSFSRRCRGLGRLRSFSWWTAGLGRLRSLAGGERCLGRLRSFSRRCRGLGRLRSFSRRCRGFRLLWNLDLNALDSFTSFKDYLFPDLFRTATKHSDGHCACLLVINLVLNFSCSQSTKTTLL
uniref:Uncharacterized protein n=1 Tax=Salix viminalis TaxID=40686 RepID=A0A6N2K245_SALVM